MELLKQYSLRFFILGLLGGLGLGVWPKTVVHAGTTGQERTRVTLGGPVTSVAFSRDGQWVATGSMDKTARVFDAATGQERTRVTNAGMVYSVAFSPDGQWVATGSADGTARVFDAGTGQ